MSYQAGCLSLQVPTLVGGLVDDLAQDPSVDPTNPMYLFYPTQDTPTGTQLGPYSVEVAMQAQPLPGDHRLILISHGSGGSPLGYRQLALHLATQGFVVACPEHPNNNRHNNREFFTHQLGKI